MKLPIRRQQGFTLVELMVSLALLGMVMTVIYSLFSTTSDSLREADSLANTLDRTRFALDHVATSLRGAGSFGSPDSDQDPWVKPDRGAKLRMLGVVSYPGWQNNTTLLEKAGLDTEHDSDGDGTSDVSFDGFIVMGAMDFPQSFEITNLQFVTASGDTAGRVKGGWIAANERGLYKLIINNPFHVETGLPPGVTLTESSTTGSDEMLTSDLPNRLIRVMDRSGYIQISGIKATEPTPAYSATDLGQAAGGVEFGLHTPWLVRNNTQDNASADDTGRGGLEPPSADDDDIGYDAALIDAYWYHVEVVPDDPGNFRLVRERLNAHALAKALVSGPGSLDATDLTKAIRDSEGNSLAAVDSAGAAERERVVITDRVVDFQVWFDCSDNSGNVVGSNTAWQMAWANPAGGDCMDPTAPELYEARMAHVRLSVRTENERKDAPDSKAGLRLDEAGAASGTGVPSANAPLRYFDVYPEAPGSARVVTVQSDVELTNFATRNLATP